MPKLKYFSENVLADLRANVPENLERYRASGFGDRADQNGWALELSAVEVDADKLAVLSPSRGNAAEISNSMRVFEAIEGMTPSLATEERVWSRLAHFECLEYTRERWPIKDDPEEKKGIFDGLTGAREKANARTDSRHCWAGNQRRSASPRKWWKMTLPIPRPWAALEGNAPPKTSSGASPLFSLAHWAVAACQRPAAGLQQQASLAPLSARTPLSNRWLRLQRHR